MLLTESSMVRSRISPPINTMATESLYNNIDFVVDVLMIPLSCCHVVVSRRKNPAVLFFFARPHFSCFVGFPQTCDPLQDHSVQQMAPALHRMRVLFAVQAQAFLGSCLPTPSVGTQEAYCLGGGPTGPPFCLVSV